MISETVSGDIDLSNKAILSLSSVSSSLNVISNLIASLPIKLYQKTEDGKILEVEKDKRLYLLNVQTEEMLTSYESRRLFVKDLLLYGSAFYEIKNIGIGEKELIYLDRDKISFLENDKEFDILYNQKRLVSYDLLYTLNSYKPSKSKGILDANRNLFVSLLYLNDYKQGLARSGGLNKIIVQPKRSLDINYLSTLSQRIKDLYNKNESVLVLNSDIQVTPINADKTIDIENLCKQLDDQVYSLFGVSEKIINNTCNELEYNSFIKNTIVPLLAQLEQMHNSKLLSRDEQDSLFFKFDTDELFVANLKDKADYLDKLVKAGIITINEARETQNYARIDSLEGVYRLSLADSLLDTNNNRIVNINTNTIMNLQDGSITNINNDLKNQQL